MKNFVLGTTLLGAGVLFGTPDFIQGIAKEVRNGMEVLESNAIQLVENSSNEKKQVKPADVRQANEADKNAVVEKTYWIGAMLGPIPEPVLAHLPEGSLEKDKGVCLLGVQSKSPAEKAGLKTFDVVTKINGNAADSEGVIKSIKDSKGEKIKFEILRAGKKQTIEVTPEEREANAHANWGNLPQQFQMDPQADFFRGMVPEDALKMIPQFLGEDGTFPEGFPFPEDVRKMLKQHREDFRKEFRKQDFQQMPQMMENHHSQIQIEITPNGMQSSRQMTTIEDGKELSVSVRKSGDEPAKILVEWDDESFETTEDKLDVLPEEIRDRVKNFVESENVKIFSGNFNSEENPITEAIPAPSDEKADSPKEGKKAKKNQKQNKKQNEKEIEIQKEDVIDLK
ncbi:MAG: PDZ domain-containing protein [Planctomycetaceae bacterium]|nr:PDZ domain-containing protein [Planctomycetaceae bacterium]